MRIQLPAELTAGSLESVVERWTASSQSDIVVDFTGQRWVHPIGTVALSCLVARAKRKGQVVSFEFEECENISYWERMRFFSNFEVHDVPSAGQARDAAMRFSEVREVRDINKTDAIGAELVDVASPSEEARQIYNHVVTEALNNLCQHSRAAGYCASQLYPAERDMVRFCIGDFGIGIKESLAVYHPADDAAAIAKALEVGVSGRTLAQQRLEPRHMRNRGIGLAAIQRLVLGNRGNLLIWSGSIKYSATPAGIRVTNVPYWQGTIIGVEMHRNEAAAPFRTVMRTLSDELSARTRRR